VFMEITVLLTWLLLLHAIGSYTKFFFAFQADIKINLFYAPIGLCILGVIVPLAMKAGLSMRQISVVVWSVAVIGLFRLPRNFDFPTILGSACAVILLAAPLIIVGPQFFYFQGNIWDHLNYVSAAALFFGFDVSSFTVMPEQIPIAIQNNPFIFWATNWSARPSVSTTLAVLMYPFLDGHIGYLKLATLYCALLASLQFLSINFILRSIFPNRPWTSSCVALASSVGFWTAFMLDTNAWSQLAVASIAPGVLWLSQASLDRPENFRSPIFVGFLFAALFFYYPEYFSLIGIVCAFIVGRAVWLTRSWPPLWTAPAFVICVFLFKEGTLLFLVQQLKFSAGNVEISKQWFQYFYSFPFRMDSVAFPLDPALSGILKNFLKFASMIGLYPLATLNLSEFFNVINAILLIIISSITVLVTIYYGFHRFFLFFSTISLGIFASIFTATTGNLYGAGKFYVWTMPFFTALIAMIIVSFKKSFLVQFVLIIFILGYSLSGLMRIPYAIMESGRPGKLPYPVDQDASIKANANFNIRWQKSLKKCAAVKIDVANPFLRQIAVLETASAGKPLFTAQNLNSYYDSGIDYGPFPHKTVDCIVTFGTTTNEKKTFVVQKMSP
jgi:hypothetical protein